MLLLECANVLRVVNYTKDFVSFNSSNLSLKTFVLSLRCRLVSCSHLFQLPGWLEASFQEELDTGNPRHEEHARLLVIELVQQLEAKAAEADDFLTKNKLDQIVENFKVRPDFTKYQITTDGLQL